MASAVCPCCGYKQSMPDTSLGKRVTCPNCDTPFTVGNTPPPSPEPTPEAAAITQRIPTSRKKPVVVEEVPIPVVEADDDIPAAEVVEADDDIPAAEVVDEAEPEVRVQGGKRRTKSNANGSGSIPRAKKARPADDEDDPFAMPDAPSPRQKKKSSGGCAIVLGLVAFLGILVCGGAGVFGYCLWNRGQEELAQATNPFGSGATDPVTAPVETRKSTETTPATKAEKPKTVVDLAKGLSNTDAAVRLESANALADMEKRAAFATPDLAKAMRTDPDVGVRRAASRALKNIGATGERRPRVEAFLYGLGDADATVQKTAKEGLDELGKLDSRDQPVLLDALEHSPSPVVQNAALDTLLNLDLPPDAALTTFTPLLKKKEPKDKELRVKAAEALGRTKVDKTKPERDKLYATLFEALGDDEARVRDAAMKGLTALGSKLDDLKKLREKLHDKTVPLAVRVWACQSIGDMMPKPTTAPQEVVDALALGDPQLKRAALAALVKLGNVDGAADALAGALTDPDKEVRRQALLGLGNLGKEAGTSTIKSKISKLMVDSDPAIRKDAADVLRKIDPDELLRSYSRALLGGTPDQRKEAADALRALGPEAKDALADLLGELSNAKIDAETRFHIALAVVTIDPTRSASVSPLIAGLKSDKLETRRTAAEALAQLGPTARDALDDLATALKDRDLVVKQNLAKALKALAADIRKLPKAQKDTIILALATCMDETKMHADAGAALVAIGPDCIDNLITLLKDRNEAQAHPQTVVGVALVLKQFGPAKASSAAQPLLNASYWIKKDEAASKTVADVSTGLRMKP